MNTKVTPLRLSIECALAACVGALITALLYSSTWNICCRSTIVDGTEAILLLPAEVLAVILGGGVHAASEVHFYIGAMIQFALLWVLARWFMARRANRRTLSSQGH
jgi:hypothetical protein